MIFNHQRPHRDTLWQSISSHYLLDEKKLVHQMVDYLNFSTAEQNRIHETAVHLVRKARDVRVANTLDAFLKEYDLSSEEGATIMCIAESILRIPDTKTGDALIEDKITSANWQSHIGESESLFVNAATWAFLFTGKILRKNKDQPHELANTFKNILASGSKPVIRQAVQKAIKIISDHFIISNTIEHALEKTQEEKTSLYSFDMLGEAAITEEDANRYCDKYLHAIQQLQQSNNNRSLYDSGVSIKLSALHPRYELLHYNSVQERLYPRLKTLALAAKKANMNVVIDAEEVDRLELQLDLFARLCNEPELENWQGLGLAVQAYQKRAFVVIDWLISLAKHTKRRIMLRLVKGAYWDTEIKRTQLLGLDNYPLFTRKESTDISFLACAKKMLAHTDDIYPMFATHNAHSVAAVLSFTGEYRDYEFQRLYGMGEQLYSLVTATDQYNVPCRVYAPCGEYEELLPYLVRRLLENGANNSFVNQILDSEIPPEVVVADPIRKLQQKDSIQNPKIPLPKNIYQPYWSNSNGVDVAQENTLACFEKELTAFKNKLWHVSSIINGKSSEGEKQALYNPACPNKKIAFFITATQTEITHAIDTAHQAFAAWQQTNVNERSKYLIETAALLESNRYELIQLCVIEAGKTIPNAINEIREAIDFCHYYAYQADKLFSTPYQIAQSSIEITHASHGVIACISPWNFPLAIFIGQVAASLVAGNTVIAKPAEQTPIIAHKTVQLMHQAGFPSEVLQLLIGNGETGAQMIADERITGVVFTGSTEVAQKIRKTLSNGKRCNAALIAETGGINAMVVDSSALLEQTVKDVIQSAFDSAGQRCSALRVVYVQQEIIAEFIRLLKGAMAELIVDDPSLMHTDIGPIIDQQAKQELVRYEKNISKHTKLICKCEEVYAENENNFFSPRAYQINSIQEIHKEAFGPILHVVSYNANQINEVFKEINNTDYGLTFGVQSRINTFSQNASERIRAGNIYINRNIIGATVGIQPFGGERMSGTGPKAGGPHYLLALSQETRTDANNSQANSAEKSVTVEHSSLTDLKPSSQENDTQVIQSKIEIAVENAYAFNFMQNDQRIEYIQYMSQAITENTKEIKQLYSSKYKIEKTITGKEVEHTLLTLQVYENALNSNIKRKVYTIGPTGQRNELHLYNRGVFLFSNTNQTRIAAYANTLAANVVVGNPLLLVANGHSNQINQILYDRLIHPELKEKYFHYLSDNNQTITEMLLTSALISGYLFSGERTHLQQYEKIIASRKGPIVPMIITDHQTMGGVFANIKNLYLISTERTISINTTAMGGNTALYSL